MIFSTFAWHSEDHYLYSISFLHDGAPKRWYGVGSDHAEAVEVCIRSNFPEVDEIDPEFVFDLITSMDPCVLSNAGVQVSTIQQMPGEFVITAPNAFHSGFNEGVCNFIPCI
jgi:histone demethylase JARID1